MADRTFHKRLTLPAKCGMGVFGALALYFFWIKLAIIAIFVVIVIVGMMERILHTSYTFKRVKPIDREEEMEFLVIDEGRFASNKNVPVCDIVEMYRAKTFCGLDWCLVIEYGHGNIVTVVPDNEEAFVKEIRKRQ